MSEAIISLSHPACKPVPIADAGAMREPTTGPASRPRLTLRAAPWIAALMVLLAAACAEDRPKGPIDYVQDENFAISDPGGRQATATGTGCATTMRQALTIAERTAHYNLRGVTGPGRYRVRYDTLRDYREGDRFCAEVEARVQY